MEAVVEFMLGSKTIEASTIKTAINVRNVALALLPMFFILTQAWNFIKTSVNNFSEGRAGVFKLSEIIRVGVLWLLVLLFIPIFSWIADFIGIISSYTRLDTIATAAGQAEYQKYIASLIGDVEVDKSFWSKAKTVVNTSFSQIFNALTFAIVAVIRLVVESIALMLGKVFFVIGPLVIAFSILPMFKEKLEKWFNVYMTLLLVPITLNILDSLVWLVMNSATIGLSTNAGADLIFGLVIIAVYILSFWITSFIAGTAEAGKVLSTSTAIVSAASTAGIGKLGSMMKGRLGSGGTGPSDAASAAKGAIED